MTLTLHTFTRAACLAAAMSTLAACPEGKGDTDSATDGATTDQTTGGTTSDVPTTSEATVSPTSSVTSLTEGMSGTSTTGPTTEGMTEGATEGTTVDVETTTASTTDGTTTTGDPFPEELEVACLAACDKFFECLPQPPFPDVDSCMFACASSLGMGPTCLEDTVAFNGCIGEMSCAEFEDAFEKEEFGPCEDEFEAMGEGCQTCEGFGSAGPDGCSIGQVCPDQPSQEYLCLGDTCTCLVDDQSVSGCPAPAAICDAGDETLAQAAFECCGFEF